MTQHHPLPHLCLPSLVLLTLISETTPKDWDEFQADRFFPTGASLKNEVTKISSVETLLCSVCNHLVLPSHPDILDKTYGGKRRILYFSLSLEFFLLYKISAINPLRTSSYILEGKKYLLLIFVSSIPVISIGIQKMFTTSAKEQMSYSMRGTQNIRKRKWTRCK